MTRQGLSPTSIDDITQAHRASTCRQYESGWKKFQGFISSQDVQSVTPSVLTSFATHVFHANPRVSPSTVTNAMVAIRDPISFGFGVTIEDRQWDLLKASFFRQRPPTTPQPPNWSLGKVLTLLQAPKFQSAPSTRDLFSRTLFLVAMATGHRVSQLAALLRSPEFTRFGPDDSSVTLATRPLFLAKNERAGHRMKPVTIHAWLTGGTHHPLCPVKAMREYLSATSGSSNVNLWLDPHSARPLNSSALAKHLVHIIHLADPLSHPRAHQVRKYASSLAFFRSFDIETVREAGQWSSPKSFVQRYLLPHLTNVPCVAMGSTPGPNRGDET